MDKDGAREEDADEDAASTTSAAERRATKNQCIAALRVIREGCIKQANGLSMLIEVSLIFEIGRVDRIVHSGCP